MGVQRSVNKGFKTADRALSFIQESFNSDDDIDIFDIIKDLEIRAYQARDTQAQRLVNKKGDLWDIIVGDTLKTGFRDITSNFNLDGKNIKVYEATDKLIRDLNNAKDWIMDYQLYKRNLDRLDVTGQLEALGLAILGKAIQLCPIDSGFLRSTGTVIVTGNSVIIGFYAPYAIYVHESMDNRHEIGEDKFLEKAAQEFLPDKSTWVEILGKNELFIKITASMEVEYTHYETRG